MLLHVFRLSRLPDIRRRQPPRRGVVLGERPCVSTEQSVRPGPVVGFGACRSAAAPLPALHTSNEAGAEARSQSGVSVNMRCSRSVDFLFFAECLLR